MYGYDYESSEYRMLRFQSGCYGVRCWIIGRNLNGIGVIGRKSAVLFIRRIRTIPIYICICILVCVCMYVYAIHTLWTIQTDIRPCSNQSINNSSQKQLVTKSILIVFSHITSHAVHLYILVNDVLCILKCSIDFNLNEKPLTWQDFNLPVSNQWVCGACLFVRRCCFYGDNIFHTGGGSHPVCFHFWKTTLPWVWDG